MHSCQPQTNSIRSIIVSKSFFSIFVICLSVQQLSVKPFCIPVVQHTSYDEGIIVMCSRVALTVLEYVDRVDLRINDLAYEQEPSSNVSGTFISVVIPRMY